MLQWQHCVKFLALLQLFFYACSSAEKSEIDLFLENVMIREKGLYVLMGSKPMSSFPIHNWIPETPKERKQHYENLIHSLKKENPESSLPTYEKFCEDGKKMSHLQYHCLWKAWKTQVQHALPYYKFTERKTPFGESKEGLFINVLTTLCVLQTHYDSFAKITSMDFDPEKALTDLSNIDSRFWEKVFQSHYLTGLLFGYGERNAMCFDWESRLSLPTQRINEVDFDKIAENLSKKNLSPSDLQLPFFSIYSLDDPTLEQYKKEREHILKTLKDSTWITKVKDRLLQQI